MLCLLRGQHKIINLLIGCYSRILRNQLLSESQSGHRKASLLDSTTYQPTSDTTRSSSFRLPFFVHVSTPTHQPHPSTLLNILLYRKCQLLFVSPSPLLPQSPKQVQSHPSHAPPIPIPLLIQVLNRLMDPYQKMPLLVVIVVQS